MSAFSLPTQRCFPPRRMRLSMKALFSAYAEVFPVYVYIGADCVAFLCLRRGVSSGGRDAALKALLFSAYAEVFPAGPMPEDLRVAFLCLRRGVSS